MWNITVNGKKSYYIEIKNILYICYENFEKKTSGFLSKDLLCFLEKVNKNMYLELKM